MRGSGPVRAQWHYEKPEMANTEEVDNRSRPTNSEPEARGKGGDRSTPAVDEYGEPVSDERHEHAKKRPLYKRPALLIGAVIVLLIVVLLGLRYWLYARSHETTDDAFIDGHIVQVSPKVSGYVAKVYITDNQSVKAGDLLVELDPRDFEATLAQAKAALNAGVAQHRQAQTQVTLTRVTTRANLQQASAGVQQTRPREANGPALPPPPPIPPSPGQTVQRHPGATP